LDYSGQPDLELVERFKEGEEGAFNELFKRYKTRLVHVAYRYTGDHQASEDIAHEVFIEVHQNVDRFQGEGRFFAYLYGIALNKSKMYIRGRVRKRELPLLPEEGDIDRPGAAPAPSGGETLGGGTPPLQSRIESPREIHDKKELSQLLQQTLEQLPDVQRRVFILTEIQELSYAEAAKSLGIARATVGAHLFKARAKLRKLLPLELLEIFYFSIRRIHGEAWFAMGFVIENLKLAFGVPSSLLLSY